MISDIIQRINEWQQCQFVHPLTCGNDSSHDLLVPEYDSENDYVLMRCPTCDYIQRNIPEQVLKIDIHALIKSNEKFFKK